MTLIVFYVAVKLAAYVAWCHVGVGMFVPFARSKVAAAIKFGMLRLGLGIVFGTAVLLFVATQHLGEWPMPHTVIYLIIYAPLRWVEWSIIGFLFQPEARSLLLAPRRTYAAPAVPVEPGSRKPGVLWKLGGIVVSHLADLPMIIAAGGVDYALPIGRFLC